MSGFSFGQAGNAVVVAGLIAILSAEAAFPQGATSQPAFEVASIKASPPRPMGRAGSAFIRGGPGSSDTGLVTAEYFDLFSLVCMAYGVERYQLSAPEWVSEARFHITARVPDGATTDQYRLMLQNLLAERFKLVLHRERRELQMYELVVAKNGLKMKESAVDPAAPAVNNGVQPPLLRPSPPPGYHGPFNLTITGGGGVSIERFAAMLSGTLGEPVVDATGLKGNYDATLHALVGSNPPAAEGTDPAPNIFDAVQQQLGLKLTPKKDLVDVLVVDHMEKTPTEN